MKKTIITAITALIAIFSMAAQNSFYYFQGGKVTLIRYNGIQYYGYGLVDAYKAVLNTPH